MNYQAALKGYYRALALFFTGALVLSFSVLLLQKPEIDIARVVSILRWLCLVAGGFVAGVNAKGQGYIHGAIVGIFWVITQCLVLWWIVPEVLCPRLFVNIMFYCLFWGAIGGLCGVNMAVLMNQNKSVVNARNYENIR